MDDLKLTRTEMMMATIDDSARYFGWDNHSVGTLTRDYAKADRHVFISFYEDAGIAKVMIVTWGGVHYHPTVGKLGEIMAEFASNVEG